MGISASQPALSSCIFYFFKIPYFVFFSKFQASSIEYRVSSLMVVWKRYRLRKEVSSAPTLRPQKNAAREYKVKRCSTKSQWNDENEQTSPRYPLYRAGSEYHDFGKNSSDIWKRWNQGLHKLQVFEEKLAFCVLKKTRAARWRARECHGC